MLKTLADLVRLVNILFSNEILSTSSTIRKPIQHLFEIQNEVFYSKQVLCSTILSSTMHFDLVRLVSDLVRLSISQTKHFRTKLTAKFSLINV